MQIHSLINFVNHRNSALLLFTVLCCLFLNPVVTGNEEIYLGWAKSYYDPDWLPNSFVYDHWVGHRYVFELFFGFLLSHLSFEAVVMIGRVMAAAAMAFSLSRLFRQINFTNLESLLVVLVFISIGQNFVPGEWIFMSIESKVFAYPLIFLSLTELLKGNPRRSALYIVGATYFHVLAAGWFFMYFLIYLLWTRTQFLDVARVFAIYVAGTLPLTVYLAPQVFSGPSDVGGIHLNWIYVFYRIPNLAPFVEGKLNTAANWEAQRILTVAVCFVLAIFWHRRNETPEKIKFFSHFIIIIGAFFFTFLVAAYFDRSGDLLKFRPFRGASLFTLFVLIEIVIFAKFKFTSPKAQTLVSHLSMATLAVLFVYGTGRNLNEKYIDTVFFPDEKKLAWREVTSFAKNQTERQAVFLIKGIPESVSWTFSRNANRDVFVLKKFVPIDKNKWHEWYQRLHVRVENEAQMADLRKKYKLDYYITTPSRPRIGKVVFENSRYVISHLPDPGL
ncbi:MAG: hypothetical protein NPINA01_31440 [Nitrospinaceae bacterium]|nr:MAG: hypothetical protein NPINA01_31440 [Nitrospinaceae bacterium]